MNSVSDELAGFCDPIVTEANIDILMRTRRLSRAVTEIYDSKLQPFGISAVQFSLLEVIGRLAPITRAAIARHQKLDKSTLTRDLRSIFSEGWVQEVRERANGRSRPVALTETGKQLLLDARPAWLAAQGEVNSLLGQETFVAFMSGMDRITNFSEISIASAGKTDQHVADLS